MAERSSQNSQNMSPPAPARAVRGVLALLAGVGLIYLIVVPVALLGWEWLATSPNTGSIRRLSDETPVSEWLFLKTLEAVMAALFFTLGASVGSFLNVVVYRWPRGTPLFWQRSYCPNCRAGIRSSDNVPLIGWLRLGGRCRDCGEPISARYPLVEATMGTLFLWLFVVQLISGGWNLPNRVPNIYTGVVWVLFYTKWDLVGYYFYHCLVYSFLLTAMLVDYDRQPLRPWQVAIGVLWLLIPPLLWPWLLLWRIDVVASPSIDAAVTMLVGGGIGLILGRLICATGLSWASGLWLGIALGWQASLGVFLFAILLRSFVAIWRFATNSFERSPDLPAIEENDMAGLALHREAREQFPAPFGSGLKPGVRSSGTTWIFVGAVLHHSVWRALTLSFAPVWPGASVTSDLLLSWFVLGGAVWGFDRLLGFVCPSNTTRQSADQDLG